MKSSAFAFLAVAAAALLAAPASAQNASPQLLTVSCSGCHGPGGHSPGAMPSIYGRTAASIAETLRDFRAGKRPSTLMVRFAKGYTDAEIDAVAREDKSLTFAGAHAIANITIFKIPWRNNENRICR